MDYYPQPRPPMYGNRDREVKTQTLTEPRRVGPPRYPPAPPTLGDEDAPLPPPSPAPKFYFRPPPNTKPLVVLYVLAVAYSVLQLVMGLVGWSDPGVSYVLLAAEIGIDALAIAYLSRLWAGCYKPLIMLVLLHVALGNIFGQLQSPAFWVAILVALYLLRPSMWREYTAPQRVFFVEGPYQIVNRKNRDARITERIRNKPLW